MAISMLLQDWTTIQLAAADSIVQNEASWLDCGAYTDLVAYVSTKQATAASGATLHLETAPSRDNELFAAGTSMFSLALTPTTTFAPQLVRYASATVPLARWVRWRISSTAATVVNFRVWLALNSQGGLILPAPGRGPRGMGMFPE